MNLKDYKDPVLPGYTYEDCYYESAESLLQTGILGFCDCGAPEENLEYVLVGLELIKQRQSERIFSSDAFFFYWADKEGYTEHGVRLPGWLTPKGQELLKLLSEWRDMTSNMARQ